MDLIRLFLDNNFNLQIFINKWILLLVLIGLIIYLLYLKLFSTIKSKVYEIDEAIIGIGNQKVKIKPNYQDMQIAYKLWVELSTRKIGLEIDLNNDVINEIYNSWYEFFKLTRELIKDIPIFKIRKDKSTKELVRIAIEVLNEGLRPHLTNWQARFRKWYNTEIEREENKNLSPQDIQKKYPEYEKLTKEMMVVNQKSIEYRKILRQLATGE
jgi:hypothetical protein